MKALNGFCEGEAAFSIFFILHFFSLIAFRK